MQGLLVAAADREGVGQHGQGGEGEPDGGQGSDAGGRRLLARRQHESADLASGAKVEVTLRKQALKRLAQIRQAVLHLIFVNSPPTCEKRYATKSKA